jgi:hypothetical protein
MVIEAGVSSRSYIGVTNKQTDRGRQVEGRHTFACVSCCCFFFFLDDPCLGVVAREGLPADKAPPGAARVAVRQQPRPRAGRG